MEDAEQTMNCIKEKEQGESVAAEEMRKRATERLMATKRRAENKETDDGEGSQNKRAKRNDMVNLMKEMLKRRQIKLKRDKPERKKSKHNNKCYYNKNSSSNSYCKTTNSFCKGSGVFLYTLYRVYKKKRDL